MKNGTELCVSSHKVMLVKEKSYRSNQYTALGGWMGCGGITCKCASQETAAHVCLVALCFALCLLIFFILNLLLVLLAVHVLRLNFKKSTWL